MKKFLRFATALSAATLLMVTPVSVCANDTIPTAEQTATIYTENDGKFEGGAEFHYNPETEGLVIDGNGSFTIQDFNAADDSFHMNYTVICKDVIVPENVSEDKPLNTFVFSATLTKDTLCRENVFTYKGSDMEKKYNAMIAYYNKQGKTGCENDFVLNLLDDDTDPYTFTFTPEEPEIEKSEGFPTKEGILSQDFENKKCIFFEYYEHSEYLALYGLNAPALDKDELLKHLKNCDIKEVEVDGEMSFNGETENEKIAAMVLELLKANKDDPKKQPVVNIEATEATEETTEEYIPYMDEVFGVFLKGDADLNGSVDLADLTTVAKFNLNNEAYPLDNIVAYKNADMNGDGVVDGLDTSMLIEFNLNNK